MFKKIGFLCLVLCMFTACNESKKKDTSSKRQYHYVDPAKESWGGWMSHKVDQLPDLGVSHTLSSIGSSLFSFGTTPFMLAFVGYCFTLPDHQAGNHGMGLGMVHPPQNQAINAPLPPVEGTWYQKAPVLALRGVKKVAQGFCPMLTNPYAMMGMMGNMFRGGMGGSAPVH